MKKILLFSALLFSLPGIAQTSTYPGNGRSSFGGPIGTGSVSITDNGSSLTFKLTKGTNNLNDVVVFYVDFTSGGISSTAALRGVANQYERAVSTKRGNGTDSSLLNFPSTFTPDAAIAFDQNGGKTFFFPPAGFSPTNMMEGNPPQVTPTGTASSPTYSQTVNKSDLNQGTGPISFKFIGTYISESAYRSDEAFGDPINGYRTLSPTADVGWRPVTISSFFTYSSTTMPVKVVDFKAVKEKEYVQLKWTVADETNIGEYQVQRSTNGVHFTTVGTLKARNSSSALVYSYPDNSAAKGVNYYRLAIVENANTSYTKVVSIKNATDKNSFTVATQGQNLSIRLSGIEAGPYKLSVMNTSGQLLQSISFQHDGSDLSKQIDMRGSISKGVYRVTLQSENAQFIKSILVQ
ncbi:MAG TPA: hypothetical protein VF622_18490 [Segetibacter sp.]|jgi:hypothetical protein